MECSSCLALYAMVWPMRGFYHRPIHIEPEGTIGQCSALALGSSWTVYAILIACILVIRWLYRRVIAVDGNMSAQHLKMHRPELDVALTDGEGYVVEDQPYHSHLSTAVEIKQVLCTCSFDFLQLNEGCIEYHLSKS